MKFAVDDGIDVYPVGLFRDLRQFRHDRLAGAPRRWRRLRHGLRTPLRAARTRDWHHVKTYLNGYLAEPADFPPGLTRCGSGWTRRRALRDYERRADRARTTP